MTTTEQRIQVSAEGALNSLNAPATDQRVAIIVPHLALIDDEVRVVDGSGNVRMMTRNPMSIEDLIREILVHQTPESRLLRWKPYGRPI